MNMYEEFSTFYSFSENEHLEMKIEEELDQKMHSPEGLNISTIFI